MLSMEKYASQYLAPMGRLGHLKLAKVKSFVPPGYFHYLENPDNANGGNVASFFNNENPEFIGLVGGLSAYSNEVLGSVFTKEPEFFSSLPRQEKNVFIASGTG